MDDSKRTLSASLCSELSHHEVEVARDAFDAIYRIDCAVRPYDAIFCDLAGEDLPGPELWAFLSLTRGAAARRMVFVASGPLHAETRKFLGSVPNPCIHLQRSPGVLDRLALRGDSPAAKPQSLAS